MAIRAQIISDVHCEFHRDGGVKWCNDLPVVAPILVIAGDFATHRQLVRNLTILCKKFEHIVFVCGNHEYYGSNRGDVNNDLAKVGRQFPNFHWLNNSSVEIEGQRFIGATMWFRDDPYNWMYKDQLNDFNQIAGFSKWVYKENRETIDFFQKNMQKGDFVVTHHLPSMLSVSEFFKDSQTNRFYVCDISEIIREKKPAIHHHGHAHRNTDHYLYDTRVVCNPGGYTGYEPNLEFNQSFTVEIF